MTFNDSIVHCKYYTLDTQLFLNTVLCCFETEYFKLNKEGSKDPYERALIDQKFIVVEFIAKSPTQSNNFSKETNFQSFLFAKIPNLCRWRHHTRTNTHAMRHFERTFSKTTNFLSRLVSKMQKMPKWRRLTHNPPFCLLSEHEVDT